MKTEQEQIKAIKQIIDERVETTLGQVQGRHDNVIKTVDTVIIARDLVNAGYGDIRQAQIDVLNKLKERAIGYTFLGGKLATETDIDELIKEVQKGEDKG